MSVASVFVCWKSYETGEWNVRKISWSKVATIKNPHTVKIAMIEINEKQKRQIGPLNSQLLDRGCL